MKIPSGVCHKVRWLLPFGRYIGCDLALHQELGISQANQATLTGAICFVMVLLMLTKLPHGQALPLHFSVHKH